MTTRHEMTLLELNGMVRDLINHEMNGTYWVQAEITEKSERSGHCYMELIQKEEKSNTPVARASAKCWRSKWTLVKAHFFTVTQKELSPGMKVLLNVTPQFHENYGFSWIVQDIDPTFTVGDMALKRERIIKELKATGTFYDNKALPLPMFAQHIAVISSESAAGYGDFCKHLSENEYGYIFKTTLFPAIMQGEQVESSVVEALNMINDKIEEYDCVVITRGGGATCDLSGFDTYNLAFNVANFPLPVITAIGHDRDESILDMVANTRVKTPTAAAAFLIGHLHMAELAIDRASQRLVNVVTNRMVSEKARLRHLSIQIPSLFSVVSITQIGRLDAIQKRMGNLAESYLFRQQQQIEKNDQLLVLYSNQKMTNERHRMDMLMNKIEALDPVKILERGYSITWHEGRAVTNLDDVSEGSVIETQVKNGRFKSVVS